MCPHPGDGSLARTILIWRIFQNIINEKMYLAMWFWFVFMIVVNTLHTFYRVSTLFFDKLRFYQLFKTVTSSNIMRDFLTEPSRSVISTTRT